VLFVAAGANCCPWRFKRTGEGEKKKNANEQRTYHGMTTTAGVNLQIVHCAEGAIWAI